MEFSTIPQVDYWVLTNRTGDGKIRPDGGFNVTWFSESEAAWSFAKATNGLYYDGTTFKVTDVWNGIVYDMEDLRRASLAASVCRREGTL